MKIIITTGEVSKTLDVDAIKLLQMARVTRMNLKPFLPGGVAPSVSLTELYQEASKIEEFLKLIGVY